MRSLAAADSPTPQRAREWRVVPMLLPYLWEYKGRVVVALVFLVTAKLANVGVPLVLKEIVDALTPAQAVLALPLALLVAYGAAAPVDDAVRRAARSRVRARHAARDPAHRAQRLPPPARAVAALPPRAPDRRRLARHRARHARHLDAALLHAVLDHPVVLEFALVAIVLFAKFDWRFMAVTFGAVVDLHRLHRSGSPSGAWTSAAGRTSSIRARTRARSTACSTTRRSSTSATRNTRRGATTRTCSSTRARR